MMWCALAVTAGVLLTGIIMVVDTAIHTCTHPGCTAWCLDTGPGRLCGLHAEAGRNQSDRAWARREHR